MATSKRVRFVGVTIPSVYSRKCFKLAQLQHLVVFRGITVSTPKEDGGGYKQAAHLEYVPA